jgi:TonB family protein
MRPAAPGSPRRGPRAPQPDGLSRRLTELRQDRKRVGAGVLGLVVLLSACATGDDRVVGESRTRENVQRVFAASSHDIYRVYADRLKNKPDLAGKVVFRFAVNAAGRVTDCAVVSSTLHDPEVEAAIVAKIRTMKFGKVHRPDPVVIRYPIDFLPI